MTHTSNFYEKASIFLGLDPYFGVSLVGHGATLLILALLGWVYRQRVERALAVGQLAPEPRPSLSEGIQYVLELVASMARQNCGPRADQFLGLLATFFLTILVSNLSGLAPGFPPMTENFSANLAMGFVAFVAYNAAGFAEHGWSYPRQFMGPYLVLAPLFLFIELISHGVRPLSLAFRLLANVFCDHLLVGVFSSIVPLVVPTVFLCFGLLVAVVQSYVFTLLTSIYINVAQSHDH